VKERYDSELYEARQTIDETTKNRVLAEFRIKHAQQQTNRFIEQSEERKLINNIRINFRFRYNSLLTREDFDQNQIELLEKELLDNEADLHLFHRRLSKKMNLHNLKIFFLFILKLI